MGPIVLNRKLGIADVEDLSGLLAPVLDTEQEIVVDASAVESIDIAALQVLVAFVNSATGHSRSVRWLCDSGVLRAMASLADIEHLLKLDETDESLEDDGLCPVF